MRPLSSWKEVITQNLDENMLKISELPKHGIEISDDFIAKHWEKLVAESKLKQILAVETAWEQQNALSKLLWLKLKVSQIKNW